MFTKISLKLLIATAISFTVVNIVDIQGIIPGCSTKVTQSPFKIGISPGIAKSSGGRSRGGSFKKRPSSSPRRSNNSRPSNSTNSRPKKTTNPRPSNSNTRPNNSNPRPSSSSPRPKPKSSNSTPSNSSNHSTPQTTNNSNNSQNSTPTTPVIPIPVNTNPTTNNSTPTTPVTPVQTPSNNSNPTNNSRPTTPVTPVPIPSNNPPRNSSNNSPSPDGISPRSNNSSRSRGFYFFGRGSSSLFMIMVVLLLTTIIIVALISLISSTSSPEDLKATSLSKGDRERDNDIVTVSKLQVALYAHTPGLQSSLSQLVLDTDTDTDEGLLELLQESSLILLRNPEYWSHVLSSSQSLHIDDAEQVFNQLSLAERQKLSQETLTNVNGRVRQKNVIAPTDEDPSAYIVVTLLVGTADDNPLFKDIRDVEALQNALEKVASVRSDYLMIFELIWSPQAENDSLTDEELLTEYTDMILLA